MKQTFEQYLEEVHMKGYTGTGDNTPDAYDSWVSQLDVEEVMDYAQTWGEQMYELGCSDSVSRLHNPKSYEDTK